jgi:hypothetical protein
MKRTLTVLMLVALTLPGCSKFMPSAMHRRAKTSPPAAAATSGASQPADHVAHQSDKPTATSPSKPATDAHSSTATGHKS